MRSGGPSMEVVDIDVDEDGEVTIWCRRTVEGEAATEYYRPIVLQAADAEPARPAEPRPGGPQPGDVVENPRFGGPMTICDRDHDERNGAARLWGQWFIGDDYGSGSFPLDASGRVVDYPPKAR